MTEYKVGDKKPKSKSKPKTPEPPKNKNAKPETIPLETHLRNELPSEFHEDTIQYIADKVRKRGTVKSEYGQIFDYKTGKTHSPEFRGGRNSVNIKTEDWKVPLKKMTIEQKVDALTNPGKYKTSYIDKSNSLATQHNHPPDGAHAPSGADFYLTVTRKWEDYGLQISEHEVWSIEKKGVISDKEARKIENKCNKIFKQSKQEATDILIKDFDNLEGKDRINKHMDLINERYGENLLDYFKHEPHGVKLKVVYI